MNSRGFPSQEVIFYDINWNKDNEGTFIRGLVVEAESGNIRFNGNNDESIAYAQFLVNSTYQSRLSLSECRSRFRKLRQRFITFGALLEQEGVKWDVTSNLVYASNKVWRYMDKNFKISVAYKIYGEPEWYNLNVIFKKPTPIADNSNIIVISETTDEVCEDEIEEDDSFNNQLDPSSIHWSDFMTSSSNTVTSPETKKVLDVSSTNSPLQVPRSAGKSKTKFHCETTWSPSKSHDIQSSTASNSPAKFMTLIKDFKDH